MLPGDGESGRSGPAVAHFLLDRLDALEKVPGLGELSTQHLQPDRTPPPTSHLHHVGSRRDASECAPDPIDHGAGNVDASVALRPQGDTTRAASDRVVLAVGLEVLPEDATSAVPAVFEFSHTQIVA